MAIEDMFHALEAQAEEQCEEARADAEVRVAAILREADEQSERIKTKSLEQAESVARAKAAQIVNAARLANKKDAAALRGGAVEDVFDAARRHLRDVRSGKKYVELFGELLSQAVECVANGECEVLVDPTDIDMARDAVAGLGRNGITVRGDLETAGGVVVTTGGGRVMHRNTLESRLDKARGPAQARVAGILFG